MPSKLGPHCLVPTQAALDLVKAGAPLVKLVSDFGSVEQYLQINPKLVVIGRAYTALTLLEQYYRDRDPRVAAEFFVNDQYQRHYRHNPLIKLWEGHNEPSFGGPNDAGAIEQMAWYAEFEVQRLALLAELGLQGVVGNFSSGYPEVYRDNRLWDAFLPAVAAAKTHNGMLGMHEYASPFMWWATGGYQRENCDGVTREHWGRRGWLTLRYRFYYEEILRPKGLHTVPLVITEAGTDTMGGTCPGMPAGAWQDLTDYWRKHSGESDPIDYWRNTPPHLRDTERYYAEQLMWYDREMRQDPYVVGATIFTFGTNSPTWQKYDIASTRVPGFLAEYIRRSVHEVDVQYNLPDPEPPAPDPEDDPTTQPPEAAPPPPVSPPPAPSAPKRGAPRTQYRRLYVLLPPTASDPEWAAAVLLATWQKARATVGGSADDAGIGNLHARAVLAINSAGWGNTPALQTWFGQHYNGLHYSAMQAVNPVQLRATLQNAFLPSPPMVSDSPPEVETGRPRENYIRRYVLFNPQADAVFVSSVARLTWAKQRFTFGGSADDAGIGDLDFRQVLAVNPQVGWGGDMQSWFASHYPGVKYVAVQGSSPQQVAAALLQAANS